MKCFSKLYYCKKKKLQDPTLCGTRSSPTSQVPETYFMTGNYKLQINIMFQKLLDR
jgi:hypothetical protein